MDEAASPIAGGITLSYLHADDVTFARIIFAAATDIYWAGIIAEKS